MFFEIEGSYSNVCRCQYCQMQRATELEDALEELLVFPVDADESAYSKSGDPSPNEVIDYYYDLIAECEDFETLEDILIEFYNEVATITLRESYMADIEAKASLFNSLSEEE